MIDLTSINKIYIAPGGTDLRMGIDGYTMIVQGVFHKDPFNNGYSITYNRKSVVLLTYIFEGQ